MASHQYSLRVTMLVAALALAGTGIAQAQPSPNPALVQARREFVSTLPIQVNAGQTTPSPVPTTDLLERLQASLAGGRVIESLDTINEFRKISAPMPFPLLRLEARLALIGRDYDRAIAAMDEYLRQPAAPLQPDLIEMQALKAETLIAQANYLAARAKRNLTDARVQCSTENRATPARLQSGERFRDCALTPEMVVVPGGSYLMGPSIPDHSEDATATPKHLVSIKRFAIGVFEVTFDEWENCVEGGGCGGYRPTDRWGQRKQPVINVDWNDAQAFVTWLSAVTGQRYRLPSEAEWEYAARGGRTAEYTTGATITTGDANFATSEGTVPVGRYGPNGYGLHDVHGNVWEWTQDCWHPNYTGAPTDGSAWTSGECERRVFRGACWYNLTQHLRLSVRFPARSGSRNAITGIRVVREIN